MKMKPIKKAMAALAVSCLMSIPALAAAPAEVMTGMPNPIVAYPTYQQAADVTGFAPLYLTTGSGYDLTYVSVISHDLADLGFQSHLDQAEVRVRTMRADKAGDNKDISGVYSVTWKDYDMDGIKVSTAEVQKHEYAAHWQVGNYLFSAQSQGLSWWQFKHLLEDQLVDASAHYYIK